MRSAILLTLFMTGLPVALAEDETQTSFQSVEVSRTPQVVVRIKVQQQAAFGDRDWLILELENLTGQPLEVENLNLEIKSDQFDAASDEKVSSDVLTTSNMRLLMGMSRTRSRPLRIRPGVFQTSAFLSDSSARSLGMPPESGLVVHARLHMTLSLTGLGKVTGPYETPTKFQFHWKFPGEDDIERLREQLRVALRSRPESPQRTDGFFPLLEARDISEAMTVQELLDGLQLRSGHDSAGAIVRHLNQHHADHPDTIAWFRERIPAMAARGFDIPQLLESAPQIWDSSFVEPLVSRIEREYGTSDRSFHITDRRLALLHFRDALGDGDISARLSAIVLNRTPLHPWCRNEENEAKKKAALIRRLGLTGDRDLIPDIACWLDCKARIYEPRDDSVYYASVANAPPSRVCDVTVKAILRLQRRDLHNELRRFEVAPSTEQIRQIMRSRGLSEPDATREAHIESDLAAYDQLTVALKEELGIPTSPAHPSNWPLPVHFSVLMLAGLMLKRVLQRLRRRKARA